MRRRGGQVFEDLVRGVDVFEPYLARVRGGGGVGGEVVGVGRVPAKDCQLMVLLYLQRGKRVV